MKRVKKRDYATLDVTYLKSHRTAKPPAKEETCPYSVSVLEGASQPETSGLKKINYLIWPDGTYIHISGTGQNIICQSLLNSPAIGLNCLVSL